MKYSKLEDNLGFLINTEEETLKLACCDCGLVHYIGITVKDSRNIMIGFKTDNRATSQLRRHNYGFLQQSRGKDRYTLLDNNKKR